MLNMLEKEINSLNLFDGNMPEIIKAIAESIPSQNIPYRMKVGLAISELMLFASQFRINIKHWNGSSIPINSIMFCIAKSGASKDSSLNATRKCFESGYDILNNIRNEQAIQRAIKEAEQEGYDAPELFAFYKDFYFPPNPLFAAISTSEGFVQHLNDLSEDPIGAGYTYSGEVGAELASNINLTEIIKLLAELYDEGKKEVKLLKARENQSREIKEFPVSALFIGSQDNLLFDDTIKRKFKTEFTTKLARRSFVIFVNEGIIPPVYDSIKEMLKAEKFIEDEAVSNREAVNDYIEHLTINLLNTKIDHLKVSKEVRDLFTLYKKYNEAVAETIDTQLPITKLTRAHLQWKAFKLSGALAIIDQEDTIKLSHYRAAIEFVELINDDVSLFEKEMVKEPYELFADYVRMYAIDNSFTITLHNLRKAGFIPMRGTSNAQLNELIKLVNSYDENGIYTLDKDSIHFQLIEKTDKILLSYVECSGNKQQRARKCSTGYICEELCFTDLKQMLTGDYAYSPFRFTNGVRGKDNIDSGCKWIVLDIDTSEISDTEAHLLLSDLNHYIVRTSDKNNPYKFRVLIELDTEVNIPDIQWRPFITAIIKDLGLVADILPKAQIYFSYSNRDILYNFNCDTLVVKPYLDMLATLSITAQKLPSKKARKDMLDDPITTFDAAFNARSKEGRRKMIWAARYARELGADKDYVISLIHQINQYWIAPFTEEDLQTYILNGINRWEF